MLNLFNKDNNTIENKSLSMSNIFWNYRTELAYNLYYDWFYSQRLNIPKNIVNTIVNSACQEFDFTINNGSDSLNKIAKLIKENIKLAEAHLCIGGMVAFKPYIKLNKIGVAVYGARDFVAYYSEFGELNKVYFKSDIRKNEFESYTLVEIHSYNEQTREYRIDNQLYRGINNDYNRKVGRMSPQLGSRVPLSSCSETAYLDDFYIIEDVDRHLCVVISLDNSMTYNKGRSIYDSSIKLIEDAEHQYKRLDGEYDNGQMKILAPREYFMPVGKSRDKLVMPEGAEGKFIALEGEASDIGISEFAPTLRDQNYINGLNEIKHQIESNCGLYYGALSNVNETQKTATEVIASKQRFYALIMMIKQKMKNGINDILENCLVIRNLNNPQFLKEPNIDITFNIGDSVLDIIN